MLSDSWWVESTAERPTLIRLSDRQVIRRKDLNLSFIAPVGYIILMSKQASSMNKYEQLWSQRSPSAFPLLPLFMFTSASLRRGDPWPLPICQKSEIIACFRAGSVNQVAGISRVKAGQKFEASSESSVFMFILTATVGRNLFCLDQCDTVLSSDRSQRGQELDKERKMWTNVCPATSYSLALICFVTQEH